MQKRVWVLIWVRFLFWSPYSSSGSSGKRHVNGVDLFYEQTSGGKHVVLLLPGALGQDLGFWIWFWVFERSRMKTSNWVCVSSSSGSSRTDFGPQLEGLNKELFTVVGWDPRGYGRSRPPDRDFPLDFFERDAKDAVDLMKVCWTSRWTLSGGVQVKHLFLLQVLGFGRFSLLGWSDGGITALIAAARNPDRINKMVVWGSNAFVSQEDLKLYNSTLLFLRDFHDPNINLL